jgi:hypothetical protein
MKPTKRNLLNLAKKLGAVVTIDHATKTVEVDAPAGHHFAMLDLHWSCAGNSGETPAERYAAAIEDLTVEGGRSVWERCTAETCQAWEDGHCGVWGN